MCNLVYTVCLSIILLSSSCLSIRTKRQLSPAVQLENELHPLFMGMYRYGAEPGAYKRSMNDLKRHISPSLDVEQDVGSLRTLMDIGKRQVSIADHMDRLSQMYSQLYDAGKKRAALSPAMELHSAVEMASDLSRAGRK